MENGQLRTRYRSWLEFLVEIFLSSLIQEVYLKWACMSEPHLLKLSLFSLLAIFTFLLFLEVSNSLHLDPSVYFKLLFLVGELWEVSWIDEILPLILKNRI